MFSTNAKSAKQIRRVQDTFKDHRGRLRYACNDLMLAVQTTRKQEFEETGAMHAFHVIGVIVAIILVICAFVGDSFWVGQLLNSGFVSLNINPTLAMVGIPAILIFIEAIMISLCAQAEEEFEETAYLTASLWLRFLRIAKYVPVFLLLVGVLWARWGVFEQMLTMNEVPKDFVYASFGHDLTFILIAVGSHVAAALIGRWLFESCRTFGHWATHAWRKRSYKNECQNMQRRIDAVDSSYKELETFRALALEDHPEMAGFFKVSYIDMEVKALELVYGSDFQIH